NNAGYIKLTQRALICSIINDVHLSDTYTKPIAANLHAYKDSKRFSECDFDFNYCAVTGTLNYGSQTTCSDILFVTHQRSKYASDPRLEYGEDILYLVRYLNMTCDLGLKFSLTQLKDLNVVMLTS
ncbi:hypothetical protein ACHAW6_000373, partial [Cyclotella cf. meneghiniana]